MGKGGRQLREPQTSLPKEMRPIVRSRGEGMGKGGRQRKEPEIQGHREMRPMLSMKGEGACPLSRVAAIPLSSRERGGWGVRDAREDCHAQ
jgi:hypothetical protein